MNKDLVLKKGDKITYRINTTTNTVFINPFKNYTIKEIEEVYGKLLRIERPTKYETLYEVKEILDDVEREYLSNLIRPFRDKVRFIKKNKCHDAEIEWLCIAIYDEWGINLPNFKSNTMYKRMELDKGYILEELGL